MLNWLNENQSILTLISILVIFVGWSVIYRNSKKITDRNESHAVIRSLITKLEFAVTEGTKFWLNPSQDSAYNASMTRLFLNLISDIKTDIKLLEKRNISLITSHELVCLRSSLTLDAEQADSVSELEKNNKIDEITSASENIKIHSYEKYMQVYPLTT